MNAFKPNPGYAWNPVKSYPRNMACYCGSQIKFKKCCLNKTPKVVEEPFAHKLAGVMKNLKIITGR